jgi:hypothetical protein
MHTYFLEPSLKEILSEPIFTSLMEADGVDREELLAILRDVASDREKTTQLKSNTVNHIPLATEDLPLLRPETLAFALA